MAQILLSTKQAYAFRCMRLQVHHGSFEFIGEILSNPRLWSLPFSSQRFEANGGPCV
jgi:hypothetical protein